MTRLEKAVLSAFPVLAAANLLLLPLDGVRIVMGHVALMVAPAAAAAMCFRAARIAARRAAATWWLVGAAATLPAVGQAIWFVQQILLDQPIPFPSVSFFLFLAFHPLFAVGVLRSLRRRRGAEAPVDLALDGLLASAAMASLMLRYVFEPLQAAQPSLTYAEVTWIVGGHFLSQLSLVAVGILVIWRRSMLSPRAAVGLAGVALVNALGNVLMLAYLDPNPGAPGDAFDVVWLVGWGLLAWSGITGSATGERAWSGRTAARVSGTLRQSVAPFAAVLFTIVALDVALSGEAGTEAIIALSLTGALLAGRLARAVGAVERETRGRRELARTRILVELSRTFAAAPRVEDALTHIMVSARRLLSADRVWIERRNGRDGARVHADEGATMTRLPVHATTSAWLAGRRAAQTLTASGSPMARPDGRPVPPQVWLAAATIQFGDRVAGTLVAERDDAGFDAAEMGILGALADQAAVALENARLLDEARQAERERLSNEKLASLGQVVAGVAHEINNPLTAIRSATELLEEEGAVGHHAETIEILTSEARRVGEIVRRMLDFVRPAGIPTSPVDIREVVQSALRSRAREHARAGIRSRVEIPAVPHVVGEPSRLEQVFLNLIINAEHAMAERDGPRELVITARDRNGTVAIRVEDTGGGIPADILGRIFDPFFTTKAPGSGTGLGLSLSHGIVRDFGGTMTAESTVGVGTIFTVRLPVAVTSVAPAESAEAATQDDQDHRRLRILLVEDEMSIRNVTSRFLRRQGHHIDTAENGRAGLEAVEHVDYDVIVTDLRMPDIGGEEFFATLRALNPHLAQRVIFISGDTVAEETREFLERSGRPFVSKPFELKELGARIRDVGVASS